MGGWCDFIRITTFCVINDKLRERNKICDKEIGGEGKGEI